jgi:MFS transporter, DHA1 family, chloramphenicol resistance protein
VGITIGPWLGGLAIGAGAGYQALGWIGAGLAACAIASVAWSIQPSLRRQQCDSPAR